jgi:hypothetical protein
VQEKADEGRATTMAKDGARDAYTSRAPGMFLFLFFFTNLHVYLFAIYAYNLHRRQPAMTTVP